jgi:hypothetical protein
MTEAGANEIANARRFWQSAIMVEKRKALQILEELKAKIPALSKLPPSGRVEFLGWHHQFETAVARIFPNEETYSIKFSGIQFNHGYNKFGDESYVAGGLAEAEGLLDALKYEVETYWSESGTSADPHGAQTVAVSATHQAIYPRINNSTY